MTNLPPFVGCKYLDIYLFFLYGNVTSTSSTEIYLYYTFRAAAVLAYYILRVHAYTYRHSQTYAVVAISRVLHKVEFCNKSELSVHGVNYIRTCMYKGDLLKLKLQHTGTRSATARPPLLLYHHPAVFFRRHPLIALSFAQGITGPDFKNYILLI